MKRKFGGHPLKWLRAHPGSAILSLVTRLAALLCAVVIVFLVGYILIQGIPNLNWGLFSLTYTTENVSLFPALVNTIVMVAVSLLVAVPLGVFSAIYLCEYAKRGSRLVSVIRMMAETLAGIPSIVYGLFGMLFFVTSLKWGNSILAGVMTVSIMILPLIMRTTEEALISVSDSFREGSFALGAGRLRTVFRIVLPAAAPGIFAGIVLAIGRIVGESAALIYTAGTLPNLPESLFSSGRTLAVHMYALLSEGLYMEEAYATAAVLLVIVVGINAASAAIAKKIAKV